MTFELLKQDRLFLPSEAMFSRRLPGRISAARFLQPPARNFQSSGRVPVQVGDKIPDVELLEDSPGNKVNLAKELTGNGVIVGVPAAFSMIVSPECMGMYV